MMRKLWKILGLGGGILVAAGCSGGDGKGGGPKDTGVYFDYAGAYATTVDMKFTDSEGADETATFDLNILVEQNGPALATAGILARAYEEGLAYDHSATMLDAFFGEVYTQTYSGASTADNAMVLDLTIEGSYAELDYEWTYAYTLTLGEKLVF